MTSVHSTQPALPKLNEIVDGLRSWAQVEAQSKVFPVPDSLEVRISAVRQRIRSLGVGGFPAPSRISASLINSFKRFVDFMVSHAETSLHSLSEEDASQTADQVEKLDQALIMLYTKGKRDCHTIDPQARLSDDFDALQLFGSRDAFRAVLGVKEGAETGLRNIRNTFRLIDSKPTEQRIDITTRSILASLGKFIKRADKIQERIRVLMANLGLFKDCPLTFDPQGVLEAEREPKDLKWTNRAILVAHVALQRLHPGRWRWVENPEAAGKPYPAMLIGKDGEARSIIGFYTGKTLGKGHECVVEEVYDLAARAFKAFKCLKPEAKQYTPTLMEGAILRQIHSEGMVPGIQPPPEIEFEDAYIGPLFKDLLDCVNEEPGTEMLSVRRMSVKDRLGCCGRLIGAVAWLAEHGWAHRDIKLENCLIRIITNEDGQMVYDCVLADMNQLLNLSQLDLAQLKAAWCPYTRAYVNPRDWKAFFDMDNYPSGVFVVKEGVTVEIAREILLKRDVYALGVLIEAILFHTWDELTYEKALEDSLNRLIDKMTHPDYKQRPSAQQVAQEFTQIFSTIEPKPSQAALGVG